MPNVALMRAASVYATLTQAVVMGVAAVPTGTMPSTATAPLDEARAAIACPTVRNAAVAVARAAVAAKARIAMPLTAMTHAARPIVGITYAGMTYGAVARTREPNGCTPATGMAQVRTPVVALTAAGGMARRVKPTSRKRQSCTSKQHR